MKRVEKFLRGGRVLRLRRHPALRGRPGPAPSGHRPGRGLPDDPLRSGRLGGGACPPLSRRTCVPWRRASARPSRGRRSGSWTWGWGYLTLDRAAATLSTGERQRMQLARAVRNRTTGVLYVLDEPSIGLHPANLRGLTAVMDDLVSDGNSVLLVDHDTQVLSHADYIVEMGPGAGADGGRVLARGTVKELAEDPASRIGPFLRQDAPQAGPPPVPLGRALRLGDHPPVHRRHPHGEAPGGGPPQGSADGGHGRLRLRQDHADPGEPGHSRALRPEAAPARPRAGRVRPGHRAGEAHRRHAHRHQRALHGGDVCQCPRRAAEDLCPQSSGQGPGIQGRGLLLQHGKAPLPPPATAPARSAWTCSSFPMWTSPVPTAGAAGTAGTRSGCGW